MGLKLFLSVALLGSRFFFLSASFYIQLARWAPQYKFFLLFWENWTFFINLLLFVSNWKEFALYIVCFNLRSDEASDHNFEQRHDFP